MIANINFSRSVPETMRYVTGPGRDNNPDRAKLIGGQGFGFEPKTDEDVKLATQMMAHNGDRSMQASPTKPVTDKALHMSLNWHPSQTPNQQEMHEAMREFLKAVGMENAMAVAHRHTDKKRDHEHIVASLIDPKTGLAYDRYQFYYKAKHKEIEWERERDQITPERQMRHDIARAARDLDFRRVRDLMRNGGVPIDPKKVEGAISLGGHFGAKLAAYRDEFFRSIGREQEIPREVPKEPDQPKRDKMKDDDLLRSAETDDPERRKFIERLQRSHKQFGGLTPAMRAALSQKPEPAPERLPQEPEQRGETDQTAEGRAYSKRHPEPQRSPPMGDDNHDEPRKRIERIRRMSGERSRQRGEVGKGNLQDRTDQTAEGRAYIKRKQSRGMER